MAKKIALGLGATFALLIVVVAMQPSSFSVERSAVIEAPPGIVIAHIQDLRAMDAWSPWAKMDPQMKISYDGPESGVGASSSWEGPQMGKGLLTVTEVKPDREVEMQLDMLSPMAASNRILFSLSPLGAATEVTWRMEGERNFVAKALSLVMSMDEMVGVPFQNGLAALKAVAESEAAGK
jgi:hypothetical protein